MIKAVEFRDNLHLEEIVPSVREFWDIRSPDLNRPGMQFCGFYDFFAYERPQIIGKVEMTYLESLTHEERFKTLKRYFSYDLPCVVICRGMNIPDEMISLARQQEIPIYRTDVVTTKFSSTAITYLNRCLAPHITKHGVLVDVYGVGVLLTGQSGVGKSEAALELIKRGHQLVADDVVDICRINDNRLIGTCPEMVRHFMEIRGIGLIDIRAMYGISAVSVSKSIDLVMDMEYWDESKAYDRLGLAEDFVDILDVQIPRQMIPVKPGRNVAIIIEVAARNLSLKRMGYNAAQEMNNRMNELIKKNS